MIPFIEITFRRAFKIWWSIIWRGYVLSMPIALVILVLMVVIIPHPHGNQSQAIPPAQIPFFVGKLFSIWLIFIVGMICAQTLAICWAMKVKWSDFRIIAVPRDLDIRNPDYGK